MFTKATIASLAALAALGFAPATHAAPSGDWTSDPASMTVKVSFADLNLFSPAGAKSVLYRIHVAAKTVCGGEPDIRLLERSAFFHSCMKATVGRAIASLDSPVVTALNAGETGATIVANRR
jgi:UrcA family protein